jgi:[ribosomal protein S5]-alanine N-acetyltransferase
MPSFPQLRTERLLLRAFKPSDGPRVEQLAGAREVASTTLTIPHPYPTGAGASWIATHAEAWARTSSVAMAICRAGDDDDPIGAISLAVNRAHRHGELGYWVGVPWWGAGYATEAARALTEYGFSELELHRIQGRHFTRNSASGRVLQKLGMQLEGIQRGAFLRWGRFEDVAVYAILGGDWPAVPTDISPDSSSER